jgi:hypothetical protein
MGALLGCVANHNGEGYAEGFQEDDRTREEGSESEAEGKEVRGAKGCDDCVGSGGHGPTEEKLWYEIRIQESERGFTGEVFRRQSAAHPRFTPSGGAIHGDPHHEIVKDEFIVCLARAFRH